MSWINCEVSLTLHWSRNCVLTDMRKHAFVPAQRNTSEIPAMATLTNAKFETTDTKFYVPVVTLSAKNYNELLEQLKTGFKRTVTRNKYRS